MTGAFTIYVTISDGKTPVSEEKEEKKETISFGAKLMVEGCDFSSNEIQAGDEIQMNVRLHNTSTTENIKNADILITEPEENFSLISDSSNIFVGDISADTTITVSYIFKISEQTPQGQYNFVVAADYSDELGNSYSRSGVVKMNVNQSVRVEFGEFYFPEMVEMADTTKATVQIMNLGKESVSNVRAVISGDGLMPENAIYIGTVEAGQQAAGETYVAITSLKSSISSYGMTTGKITYYYEDKNGKTYEEEKEFQVMITSPFSENKVEKKEEPRQWWKIVMTVVGIIVGFGLFIFVRHIREKREENENS